MADGRAGGEGRVWRYALGYFAAYAPYAAITKALSSDALEGVPRTSGLELVPIATLVSAIGMVVFLGVSGISRGVPLRRVAGVPVPRAITLASGACTAAIVVTTTLSYTFAGASIVLMMLLMRGGVLVIAPIVDTASGRRIRWYSAVGLVLSMLALADAIDPRDTSITIPAAIDVVVYLVAYFVRLRAMSQVAKRDDAANRRFFVEEQLVATPLAVAALAIAALVLPGEPGDALRRGWTSVAAGPALPWIIAVGLLSQGTGIFGALVLLDARESSFTVPVNRASSILAGVLATLALCGLLGGAPPDTGELVGAGLVLAAIAVLAVGPRLEARRARETPVVTRDDGGS